MSVDRTRKTMMTLMTKAFCRCYKQDELDADHYGEITVTIKVQAGVPQLVEVNGRQFKPELLDVSSK